MSTVIFVPWRNVDLRKAANKAASLRGILDGSTNAVVDASVRS
jgi:hypothetical protein